MSRRNACGDLEAGTADCKRLIRCYILNLLTDPYSFMAASKVLGEESVKEQAHQQGSEQK